MQINSPDKGRFTHVCKLGAWPWQVSEGSEISGEGMDGALARMQGHLAAGRLAEAADALEAGARGSAAEKAASEWARDARARALADQTTELLQAHACSLAVSQS